MAGALVLMATGCSNDTPTPEEIQPVGTQNPITPAEEEVVDLKFSTSEIRVAQQMADFSTDFLREVAAAQDRVENLIVSPLSAQILLSMLANATDNEAQKEIAEALGCSDIAAANTLSHTLLTDMPRSHRDVKMALANSVWYNDTYAINPTFEEVLNTYYNTTSFARDFSNTPVLVDEINKWCADHTNNLIDKIVQEQDIAPTVLTIMANAMYFKAPWANPFDGSATTTDVFKGQLNNSIVEMMHQKETMDYIKGENWTAVEVPYTLSRFNAWFVLPDEGTNVDDLVASIKLSELNSYSTPLHSAIVDFSMPRFEFKTEEIRLEKPLRALGVNSLFENGKCTMFTTEAGGPIKISQKSAINFDEKGAEASSVTWVNWSTSTGEEQEPQYLTFNLNRPFLFFITENKSGACLMAGKIVDL